ncbi:MAG: SAM-dependent methyltransferase, partial [Rhodococcus sp. (in: high G+C Gram-positive bacteria)]|nr:SAM-dependent methyltransferase [Rhodococcus sp. (in: high G+C Gram-positive bacteria)]MDX5454027.1 SAM-dependent methyltransferase [Rhodococcus sp. (in: high G+C Gram-positive bacteria)]
MTVLDSLAPCPTGRWSHAHVTVERVPAGPISLRRDAGRLHVTHSLGPEDLSERLVADVTASIAGSDLGREEFELTMVGLVRSTVPGALDSWVTYYRNSLTELLDGTAEFAPIHDKAA